MKQVNSVRDVFDSWARQGRAEGMEHGHGPAAQEAFGLLGIGRDSRYLDIGCGNGYTVRWAAAIADEVRAVGLDVSSEMIARARSASTGFSNATFINDVFPTTALGQQTFDAIFSMEVFYYLDDLDAGMRAVAELLAPRGQFACVVDFYQENPDSHSWPEDLGLKLHLLSELAWRKACEQAGLVVTEQRRIVRQKKPGEEETWKHRVGSLLTLAQKPV